MYIYIQVYIDTFSLFSFVFFFRFFYLNYLKNSQLPLPPQYNQFFFQYLYLLNMISMTNVCTNTQTPMHLQAHQYTYTHAGTQLHIHTHTQSGGPPAQTSTSIECKSHKLLCVNFHKKVNQFKCQYKLKILHSMEASIYVCICVCIYVDAQKCLAPCVCMCFSVYVCVRWCVSTYDVEGRAFALRLKLSMQFLCGILFCQLLLVHLLIYMYACMYLGLYVCRNMYVKNISHSISSSSSIAIESIVS